MKAATDNSISELNHVPATTVSAEGIEHVLQNIGMGNRMSRSKIDGIISKVGTCCIDGDSGERSSCVISANQMVDLTSKDWEDHRHGRIRNYIPRSPN